MVHAHLRNLKDDVCRSQQMHDGAPRGGEVHRGSGCSGHVYPARKPPPRECDQRPPPQRRGEAEVKDGGPHAPVGQIRHVAHGVCPTHSKKEEEAC